MTRTIPHSRQERSDSDDPTGSLLDEAENGLNFRGGFQFFLDDLQCSTEIVLRAVDQSIGFFD